MKSFESQGRHANNHSNDAKESYYLADVSMAPLTVLTRRVRVIVALETRVV